MALILIAEEDDDIRAILHRVFRRAGFDVLTAADGRAALDSVREHHPDVVLTDLDIPHLDGLQLCQAIRQDPLLTDTLVAILSGGLQPGDPRTADAEVCGVLLKPFSTGELVTAVRGAAVARNRHGTIRCRSAPQRAPSPGSSPRL